MTAFRKETDILGIIILGMAAAVNRGINYFLSI